ncbi:hypothetical protein [Longirhabdus pacifica]|uniref:hypothetical protein n=1 Tax=Longirhabdus pacifica TaxID=2305227 RepID=UPI0010089C28|nr:hypothetical protein [Longirhabdus pacifica]
MVSSLGDNKKLLLTLGTIITFITHIIVASSLQNISFSSLLWFLVITMWISFLCVLIYHKRNQSYSLGETIVAYRVQLVFALLISIMFYITPFPRYIEEYFIIYVAMFQFVYVGPAIVVFSMINKRLMQGVILGAIITILVSIACVGSVLVSVGI